MACAEDYDFLSLLITLVRQNKLLYEKKDSFYFNRVKKEKAWEDIARQRNKTVNTPQGEIWSGTTQRGQAVWKWRLRGREWALFSELLFLKESMKPRRTRCNEIVEYVTDSNSPSPGDFSGENSALDQPFTEESNQSFTTSTPAKRKKVGISDLCEQFGSAIGKMQERLATNIPVASEDSDELFMRTIVSMIKDLPSAAKDNLKEHIFLKVLEARRENQK